MTHGKVIEATADDVACAATAIDVGHALTAHYPGHLWLVGWQGGSIVVRDASISGDYGFYIHPDQSATSSELARKAVMYGGELLARAKIKRGKFA